MHVYFIRRSFLTTHLVFIPDIESHGLMILSLQALQQVEETSKPPHESYLPQIVLTELGPHPSVQWWPWGSVGCQDTVERQDGTQGSRWRGWTSSELFA